MVGARLSRLEKEGPNIEREEARTNPMAGRRGTVGNRGIEVTSGFQYIDVEICINICTCIPTLKL